jgi:hypothetical protein
MTPDEFRERLMKANERLARTRRLQQILHDLDEIIEAELAESQAEYDTLWSWFLQRLARGDDDAVM